MAYVARYLAAGQPLLAICAAIGYIESEEPFDISAGDTLLLCAIHALWLGMFAYGARIAEGVALWASHKGDLQLAMRATVIMAKHWNRLGRADEALMVLQSVLASKQLDADTLKMGHVYYEIGIAKERLGQTTEALLSYRGAASRLTDLDNRRSIMAAHNAFYLAIRSGDMDGADQDLLVAQTLLEDATPVMKGNQITLEAMHNTKLGQYGVAAELADELMQAPAEQRVEWNVMYALNMKATGVILTGTYEPALAATMAAIVNCTKSSVPLFHSLANDAVAKIEQGVSLVRLNDCLIKRAHSTTETPSVYGMPLSSRPIVLA